MQTLAFNIIGILLGISTLIITGMQLRRAYIVRKRILEHVEGREVRNTEQEERHISMDDVSTSTRELDEVVQVEIV